MNLKMAVAQSDDVTEVDAVDDVIDQLFERLDGPPDAMILLASIDYDHSRLLKRVHDRAAGVQVVGGSTDGAFSAGEYVEDGITALAFNGTALTFRTGACSGASNDPERAALQALEGCGGVGDASVALFFGDGLGVNTSRVLRELRRQLGDVPLIGGTTGDHWQFKRSVTFHGVDVMSDGCVLMLIDGPISVATGVRSGWTPMGRPMQVTDIEGNVLKALDGRPALDVFRDFFGEEASRIFGEYPLAVFEDDGSFFLRAATHVDVDTNEVVLAAEIPPGSTVQITNVESSAIIDGARRSLNDARSQMDTVVGAFVVSCAARKWMLGEGVEREAALCQEILGDVPVVGFYSFGEIAPTRPGLPSRFHNETFVTLLLHG